VLCVGETLAQREAGETMAVVIRQLKAAFAGHAGKGRVTIAYEPVLGNRHWDATRPQRTPPKCIA